MVAIAAALMRRVLPAILLLAASAASQKHLATRRAGREPDTAPPHAEVVSAARQFACVSEGNGEVLALGSRWRAVFGDSDVSFQPAFGRQAARDWPLRLELLTIRRQDAALPTAAPMRRVDQALRRVEFDRGTVVERYEARPEGLELSLVFAEKPPGNGDLEVVLAVETDLLPTTDPDPPLRWRQTGLGGIDIGGVVGIDDQGRRTPGRIRRQDDRLVLSLPESFVEDASYPLVLDPLIGPAVETMPGYDNDFPDVAYEPFSDSYCVCWTLFSSSGTADAAIALVRASDLQVPVAFTANQTGSEFDVRVTTVAGMGCYVVVWQNVASANSGVLLTGMALEPLTPAAGPLHGIAGPADIESAMLSGEATVYDDDCLIVWDDAQYGICGSSLTVMPDLTLGMLPPVQIGGGPTATELAISKQGGPVGNHLVTWVDRPAGFNGWVRGQAVDHDMNLLGPGVWLYNGTQDVGNPACDGDGHLFLVAWDEQEVNDPSATDVRGRTLTIGPQGITAMGPPLDLAVFPSFQDGQPDVALLGDSFGLVYQTAVGNQPFADDIYFRVISRNGSPCGDEQHIDMNTGQGYAYEHGARIISRRDGDATSMRQDGLIVFADQNNTNAESDVGMQVVSAMGTGGTVVDIGGGCGGAAVAGQASTFGPAALGNSNFSVELFGAPPLAIPFLLIGLPGPAVQCGVCSLTQPLVFEFQPNTNGSAARSVPMPCDGSLIGAVVEFQWALWNVNYVGCPLAAGMAATNRIQATVGP